MSEKQDRQEVVLKQDRQGARSASELVQRLNLGQRFADVLGVATGARETAEKTQKLIKEGMTQEAIFNILTNNGKNQGLYRGEDGELYINASYIVAGILKSLNNATQFNLDDGVFTCVDENGNSVSIEDGHLHLYGPPGRELTIQATGYGAGILFWNPANGENVGYLGIDQFGGDLYLDCAKINPGKKVLYSGNVTAGNTFDVPLTKNYDLFAVKLGTADSTEDTVVLAYKNGNTINGVGGWAGTASLSKELFFLSATFESINRYDATWTVVDARKQGIYNAGSITSGTALNVKEVVGII